MSDPKNNNRPDANTESQNPQTAETGNSEAAAQAGSAAETEPAQKSVKKGLVIILAAIILSLLWYLLADRFTPYTQQARINGYVIGISSEVSGTVTKVMVKNNQAVKKGQPLFQLDRTQYEIALSKARSDLEKVLSQIEANTAGVLSAQSSLLAAKANAKKARQDIERLEKLYKEDPGAISVRRLESSRANYEQAVAKVAQAEAEVVRAIENRGAEGLNNAQLKSAQSAVDQAQLNLRRTLIKAPLDGRITDLRTDAGQFASAGKPVMTLISIHDIWIDAEFTENNLGHMKVNDPVELVLDVLPGKVFTGKVRSIGLGVATSQPPPPGTLPTINNNRDWLRQAQRFPVVIQFDRKHIDELRQHIRIGGQAEVMVYTRDSSILNVLGKAFIRFMSWLSYAY